MTHCLVCKYFREDELKDEKRELHLVRFWCNKTNLTLDENHYNCPYFKDIYAPEQEGDRNND